MKDIERAIARLKGQTEHGPSVRQTPPKITCPSDASGTVSSNLHDVDLDIGALEDNGGAITSKPDENRYAATGPAKSGTYDTRRLKKSQQQLSDTPGISTTHILPFAALEKAGYIIPDTPKCQITEEYRRIKRPILKRLDRRDDISDVARNVIAVTSAMSGEGKTFSAINLAMSLALEKDRTVMLIDADVVRHTAGELFGVPPKGLGLLDLLDNDALKLTDVILKTNVERLHFLPAGRNHAHASELLSSDSMSRLIAELSGRYDDRIIVIDCPPIMQTNEAAVLVDHADQIVFVVAEEQTSQGVVMQALRVVGDENKVGILLNKSTTRLGHYDYYNYAYS